MQTQLARPSWWTATALKSSARSTKFKSFLGDDIRTIKAVWVPYNTFKKDLHPEAKDHFIQRACPAGENGAGQGRGHRTASASCRHVKPSEPDNFGIASADSVITQFRQIIGTVRAGDGGDFLHRFAGGQDRCDEHHAGVGQRTHA